MCKHFYGVILKLFWEFLKIIVLLHLSFSFEGFNLIHCIILVTSILHTKKQSLKRKWRLVHHLPPKPSLPPNTSSTLLFNFIHIFRILMSEYGEPLNVNEEKCVGEVEAKERDKFLGHRLTFKVSATSFNPHHLLLFNWHYYECVCMWNKKKVLQS